MDLDYEIRLNRLVEEALAKPDAERREFLRRNVDDNALLEDAWQLIQEMESPDEDDDFLEKPVVQGLGQEVSLLGGRNGFQLPFEESGPLQVDQIGPYHLIRPLGAGGMGRVYLAEQHRPVHRKVALKLIRSSVLSPEAQARFDAERQALARLSHPNIGRLLEADTTSYGLQYFVMELVDGEPIHRFADRRNLDIAGRVALIRDVCLGVQHAHQRQILHRDLKPSNILIAVLDGEPVPKIIDFGIAKMLDAEPSEEATSATLGRVLGTPNYMSPEALENVDGSADVDQRSDVYSLGILLYELISGLRPFESEEGGLAKLLRRIAEEPAPRPAERLAEQGTERQILLASRRRLDPAALRRALGGDLEWVVMKAVAKDLEERYDSAGDLAEELDRYLRGERIEAGPPRVWRDIYRQGRRHSRAMAWTLLATTTLGAGFLAVDRHRQVEQLEQDLAGARHVLDSERLAADRFVYSMRRFLESHTPPSAGDLMDITHALHGFHGATPAGRLELMVVLAEHLRDEGLRSQAQELGSRALGLCLEILGPDDTVTRRAHRLVDELCADSECRSPIPEATPFRFDGTDMLSSGEP